MDTTAKEELRALVETLDEGEAAAVLAYARWLLDKEQTSRPAARPDAGGAPTDEPPRH